MKEYLKLLYRAWKYRMQTDKDEIIYLLNKIPKGSVVMDVGAHKGGYTFWLKKAVGNKGKVFAFEPQKKGVALLQLLFGGANVVVENLALSDEEGIKKFYIQPQSYDVSFEASLKDKYEEAIVEEIQTTTIDRYCGFHQLSPSFLKIDVEGAEENVINGALEVLRNHQPVLLIEIEARHIGEQPLLNLCHKIERAGYKGSFFYMGNKLEISAFRASIHQDTTVVNSSRYANNFVFEPV